MEVQLRDVLGWIMSRSEDADHDAIYAAIKRRREGNALIKAAAMKRGDRVEVTGGIRPKYLKGATGKITRIRPGNRFVDVTLDLKQPPGISLGKYEPYFMAGTTRTEGHTVGFPASVLTVIE